MRQEFDIKPENTPKALQENILQNLHRIMRFLLLCTFPILSSCTPSTPQTAVPGNDTNPVSAILTDAKRMEYNNTPGAIALYDKILKQDPHNREALVRKHCLMAAGEDIVQRIQAKTILLKNIDRKDDIASLASSTLLKYQHKLPLVENDKYQIVSSVLINPGSNESDNQAALSILASLSRIPGDLIDKVPEDKREKLRKLMRSIDRP